MKVQLAVVCDWCGNNDLWVPFRLFLDGKIRISSVGEQMLLDAGWKLDAYNPYSGQIDLWYSCPECAGRGK